MGLRWPQDRWMSKRGRGDLRWSGGTSPPTLLCAHAHTPAAPLLPTWAHRSEVKRKHMPSTGRELQRRAALKCGRSGEQLWLLADSSDPEMRSKSRNQREKVVRIGLCVWRFTAIWSNVPRAEGLLGRRCVRVCEMLGSGDERWHAVKMTVSHKPMPPLIHLCLCVTETGRRCHSDRLSVTDGAGWGWGVVFWMPTLALCFCPFSSVYPSFSFPLYPSIIPTCLLLSIWMLLEDGLV